MTTPFLRIAPTHSFAAASSSTSSLDATSFPGAQPVQPKMYTQQELWGNSDDEDGEGLPVASGSAPPLPPMNTRPSHSSASDARRQGQASSNYDASVQHPHRMFFL